MINKERLQLGIAALRSGEYERGHGVLHHVVNGKHTWCCLGVLSDVAAKNGCPVSRVMRPDHLTGEREIFGEYRDEYLSLKVRNWYGFEGSNPELRNETGIPYAASDMNDNTPLDETPGFGYIADAFERTYIR